MYIGEFGEKKLDCVEIEALVSGELEKMTKQDIIDLLYNLEVLDELKGFFEIKHDCDFYFIFHKLRKMGKKEIIDMLLENDFVDILEQYFFEENCEEDDDCCSSCSNESWYWERNPNINK
jgi:hypothetical protein